MTLVLAPRSPLGRCNTAGVWKCGNGNTKNGSQNAHQNVASSPARAKIRAGYQNAVM